MANLKVYSDSFSHTWSRSLRRSFGLHWSFIERHWFVEIISKPPERKKPQKLTVNEGDFSRPPTETQPLTVTVSTNTHTQANKRKKGTQNGWNLLWMPAYSVLMDLGSFDFQDRPWDRRARDVSHPQEQMCPLTHPFPWSALFLTQALTFGSLFPSWNKKIKTILTYFFILFVPIVRCKLRILRGKKSYIIVRGKLRIFYNFQFWDIHSQTQDKLITIRL